MFQFSSNGLDAHEPFFMASMFMQLAVLVRIEVMVYRFSADISRYFLGISVY